MPATVFTIANQKGGVGKTTTALNLAAGLAEKSIPTLLIDLDAQANATSGLGLERAEGGSLYGPLHGNGDAAERIVPTSVQGLSLIPAELDLASLEIELARMEHYLSRLRSLLQPLRTGTAFRALVIDCPPALGLTSMNALAAADFLLITLQSEYLALEGLGQILRVVDQLKEAGANPNLEIGGILMTMFDGRTNLSRQVEAEVRQHFGEKVFRTVIPRTVRLSEAPSFGQTIFQYDKSSPGALAYRAFADEVAGRFQLA